MGGMNKNGSTGNEKPAIRHHYSEINVSRLGLISVQRQIAKDFVSWIQTYDFDETVEVRCIAHQDYGVPHGVDSDIFNAILHLYVTKGAPDDGRITCSIYELLRTAGINVNSRSYAQVKESVERLMLSQYTISRAWRDHERKRWITATFRHIENVIYTENENHVFDSASFMEIHLPNLVVESIKAGYDLPLEDALLKDMAQPTSRGLYRLLEAQRRDPVDPTRMEQSITRNVMDWANTCKLQFSDKPDRVRRSLEKAHEEMLKAGFLTKVEYEGRGQKQTITYHFSSQPLVVAPSELVDLLTKHGIKLGIARKLAARYPDQVRPAVKQFESMMANNYQANNPPGLLYKMVENLEDYLTVQPQKETALPEKASTPRRVQEEPVEDIQGSLQDQVNATMMFVQALVRLTPSQLDTLKSGLLQGRLNVDEFSKSVSTLAFKRSIGQLNELVQKNLLELTSREA